MLQAGDTALCPHPPTPSLLASSQRLQRLYLAGRVINRHTQIKARSPTIKAQCRTIWIYFVTFSFQFWDILQWVSHCSGSIIWLKHTEKGGGGVYHKKYEEGGGGGGLPLADRHNNQAEISELIRLRWISLQEDKKSTMQAHVNLLSLSISLLLSLPPSLPLFLNWLAKPILVATRQMWRPVEVFATIEFQAREIFQKVQKSLMSWRERAGQRGRGSMWQPQDNHNMKTCREHSEQSPW